MKKGLLIIGYLLLVSLFFIGCAKEKVGKDFNVTFIDYDGTVLKKEIVEEGGDATPPTELRRIGYEFSSWDKGYQDIKDNLLIRASYVEANPVIVNLYINDILYKKITINMNEEYDLDDLSDTEYFSGWYNDSNRTKKVENNKIIANENKDYYVVLDYEADFLYKIVDGKAYITGFTGDYSKVLVIPDEIDEYEVTGINDYAFANYNTIETVVLPEGVLNINEYAFYNCKRLKNVFLADSIEVIEQNAFLNCISLENINIPTSLTELRNNSFDGCINLKEISITENVKKIDIGAFRNTGFVNIHIPANVEIINNSAFENCYNLETITFDYGLNIVGTNAFNNCIKLEEIALPDSVTKIGTSVFEGCINLRKVTIPYLDTFNTVEVAPFAKFFSRYKKDNTYSVQDPNQSAFKYYIPLPLEEVVITRAKTLPNKAFYELSSIKKITLPDSLTSIGINAFNGCTKLEDINIPKDIVIIPENTFKGCIKLQSVLLPKYVQRIDAGAFENTKMNILFESDKLPVVNVKWNPNNNPTFFSQTKVVEQVEYFTVKFIDSDSKLLKEETVKKGESATAPEVSKKIGYVFNTWDISFDDVNSDLIIKANYTKNEILHKIKFLDYDDTLLKEQYVYDGESGTAPINLKRDNYEFVGWDEDYSNIIADVEIKAVYEEILKYTVNIYLNDYLSKSLTIDKNSTYNLEDFSGYSYFNGWYSDKELTQKVNGNTISVTKNLDLYCFFDYIDKFEYKVIGTSAIITGFNGTLPKLLIIPNSIDKYHVSTIEKEAFVSSNTLEEVIIPDGLYTINSYAFMGNKSLKKVSLGDTISNLSTGVFQNCSELTDINIPSSLVELSDALFESCTKLTEINIPNNITKIGADTFANCTGLTKVYIPSSVTQISNSTFSNCVSLIDVQIEEGLKFIGSSVFSNCTSLEEIVLPNTLLSMDDHLFENCSSLKRLSIPFLGDSSEEYFHIGRLFSSGEFQNSVMIEYFSGNYYIPKDLEEVSLTNTTRVPKDAFYKVETIKKINLPNMLTSIFSNSFRECKIAELFIPKSVISITNTSFQDCTAIFYCEISSKPMYWDVDWVTGINVFYSQKRR